MSISLTQERLSRLKRNEDLFHIISDTLPKRNSKDLKLDIVRKADPCKCPSASAIVLVNKNENDLAELLEAISMCQDYRKLNFITIKDAYPVPRIEDIITRLCKAKYFVSLDL